jgi:hypothetical protein
MKNLYVRHTGFGALVSVVAVILVGLLLACATAPVIIHIPPGHDHESQWAIATAVLPVHMDRIEPTDTNYHTGKIGEVHVWIVRHLPKGQAGHAHQRVCDPIIEVHESSARSALGHELGHTLGLEHVKDRENVMFWVESDTAAKLTKKQKRIARRGAGFLRLCRAAREVVQR